MKNITIGKIEYGLIDIKRIEISSDSQVWFLDKHDPLHLKGVSGHEAFLDGIHIIDKGDKVDIKIEVNGKWTWISNLIIHSVEYSSDGITKVRFSETDRTRIKVTL